jgi:uncharacterized protein
MPTTHLLYLHGFRSSPMSAKARLVADMVAQRFPATVWWCPPLPPSPREAMAGIEAGIADWPDSMAVVGSSLGGYYATWVAERRRCKAVLLNPAVAPARDLAAHIGRQTAFHAPDTSFFFQPGFIGELQALHAGPLRQPQHYLAVIAKGDEVLDWKEMAARYAGARLRLLEGGDHALSDFDIHLPAVLDFLDLAA